jgi:hypothetical protein
MAMLVTVAGLSVLTFARLKGREILWSNHSKEAGVLAEAAVEWALIRLTADTNWRTTYTNGVETSAVAFGNGTISFKLLDETDGDLADENADPVRIYGIGRAGAATRIYSVQAGGSAALTCLNAALAVGGLLRCDTSIIAGGSSKLATNNHVNGGSATVTANVEAAGNVVPQSWTLQGTATSGVPHMDMPTTEVFDYYTSCGTPIPIGSIPLNGSQDSCIEKVVISPASNPYGAATNTEGIYVIDCQNNDLVIRNCRIVGTLVLITPGSQSRVGDRTSGDVDNGRKIHWVPAVSTYPCLLVQGSISLSFDGRASAVLSESSCSSNFNPAGTPYPYPSGGTNTTMTDTYPSVIAGLVYVSGTVDGQGWWPRIDMLVVGGSYSAASDTLSLNYSSKYVAMPPPGFSVAGGALVPASASCCWEKAP